MDAPNFLHLLADGQLVIFVADAVSPSIRYLWPIAFNSYHGMEHVLLFAFRTYLDYPTML